MNSKRIFYGMVGLIVVLCLGATSVVVYGNQLLKQRATKLMALKLDNRLLDEQQTALVVANKDIGKYADLEKIAKSIVPQDKNQAQTVREILNIAQQSQIPISNISFPASTLGALQVPTAATGTATPGVAIPSVSQVKPVLGINGLYSMDIVVQSDSNSPRPYANLITFLGKLEQNRRTAQVTQLIITPNQKNIQQLSFNLTIKVFIKP